MTVTKKQYGMNTSNNEEKEEISRGNRCKNLWYRWKLTIGDRNEIRMFPITNKIMIIVQKKSEKQSISHSNIRNSTLYGVCVLS